MSVVTEATAPLVMDRLKTETRPDHDATEAIGFSRRMVERTLPRDCYVGQLVAYRIIHTALDAALASSGDPAIRAVWRDDLAKTPLLDRDVTHFRDVTSPPAVIEEAERYAADINRLAETDPVALLGHLYVLEGSTLGATILRGHIAAMYDITPDTGMAYYSPYGNEVMPHWKAFKARMNEAVTDQATQDRVVAAAGEAFRRLGRLLELLSPAH